VDNAKVSALAQHSGKQSAKGLGMKVKVTGAAAKIDAIFRFDKDAWKVMQKEVRSAGGEVQSHAQSLMPSSGLSGWGPWIESSRSKDLTYTGGQVKRIGVSVRSKQVQGLRRVKAKVGFSSGNAAGAIFGLAGSVSGTKSPFIQSSINFKEAMNRKHGGSISSRNARIWPRALTPAYYAKGPRARERIGAAIERMVSNVNR
jgi:hypothetical protein